ncbi:MAG: hypothetical protein ACJ713_04915 [Candidatus Sulfotelmatobacter sp.]
MGRVSGLCRILLFAATVLLLASAFAQDERVLYHAQVFTADPQNPYADAVASRRKNCCRRRSARGPEIDLS